MLHLVACDQDTYAEGPGPKASESSFSSDSSINLEHRKQMNNKEVQSLRQTSDAAVLGVKERRGAVSHRTVAAAAAVAATAAADSSN